MAHDSAPSEQQLNDEFMAGYQAAYNGVDPEKVRHHSPGPLLEAWLEGFAHATEFLIRRKTHHKLLEEVAERGRAYAKRFPPKRGPFGPSDPVGSAEALSEWGHSQAQRL